MARPRRTFDPYGILQALDRYRVQYVLIGGFAVILHSPCAAFVTGEPEGSRSLRPLSE